jgi:hypothetical protein
MVRSNYYPHGGPSLTVWLAVCGPMYYLPPKGTASCGGLGFTRSAIFYVMLLRMGPHAPVTIHDLACAKTL